MNGQAQGGANMGLIHLTAHDLHLGEQSGGGFTGLEDAVEIVVAIEIGPVLGIDVQLQAIVSREGFVVGAADQFHPEVEGVTADIFHGNLLGDDVAGDDIDTLGGEIGTVGGFFVDFQLDIAGGHHVGGLADGGIVGQGGLGQHGEQDGSQGDEQQPGFCFHGVSSFPFCGSPCQGSCRTG